MTQLMWKGSTVPGGPAGDQESMVKQLLLAAARGAGAGVLRVVLALLAAVVVNSAGAALVLAFGTGLEAGGRSGSVVVALTIVLPFILALGVTGMMAYKQGLMGILSRVLETQAPALAGLGSRLLEKFLRKIDYRPGGQLTDSMLDQWRKFLSLQEALPKPLPFLLGSLAGKVPFSDSITRVGITGMTLQDVAQKAMDDLVRRGMQGGFRPEAGPLAGALALQFALWVVLAAVLHYR